MEKNNFFTFISETMKKIFKKTKRKLKKIKQKI